MTFDAEHVYRLLPEVYRTRDAAVAETLTGLLTPDEQAQLRTLRDALASGTLTELQQTDLARLEEKRLRGPLKALVTILAEQAAALEENVDQLYDDQFIETCAAWVVPYLADLIGFRPLEPQLQERLGTERSEVANTIRFRRRKGTAAVLEELAVNVTAWDARVVEAFLRLATTQHLDHVRLGHHGAVDLRRTDRLERIGSAFDDLAHTADVRRIASGRGSYNIPNVAVYLWRIGSRSLTESSAFRVDDRRYMFDPLGANRSLYHAAERTTDVAGIAGPLDVPAPISRRVLRRHLAEIYGPGSSIAVRVGAHVLGVDEVEACDLSDLAPDPATSPWAHDAQTKAAIDPVLGRLMLAAPTTEPVSVTFHYGAAADIGGGEHERDREPAAGDARRVPADRAAIADALQDVAGTGTVEIGDSRRYDETPALAVAEDAILELRAVNGRRPLLQLGGDLVVEGGDSGEVVLDGLVIAGGRIVVPAQAGGQPNRLQRLYLVDCTVVPGTGLTRDGMPNATSPGIVVEAPNVTLEIERCIVGALRVVDTSEASIVDSVVDALAPDGAAYAAVDGTGMGGPVDVTSSTVVGTVRTRELRASDAILHARQATGDPVPAVYSERRQVGYVRYSYVPLDSQVPRRYRCHPAAPGDAGPSFTTLRYGHPAYCQLHAGCPRAIRCGASDRGEMGAGHHLYGAHREAGLLTRLDEYLRFGLEAGVFHAS